MNIVKEILSLHSFPPALSGQCFQRVSCLENLQTEYGRPRKSVSNRSSRSEHIPLDMHLMMMECLYNVMAISISPDSCSIGPGLRCEYSVYGSFSRLCPFLCLFLDLLHWRWVYLPPPWLPSCVLLAPILEANRLRQEGQENAIES